MALDLTQSPPIPLKKTLVLVNAFIIDTTRFLNHFATLAEEKLHKVSTDISRVETALVLLESRLQYIEGLDPAPVDPTPTAAALAMGTLPAAGQSGGSIAGASAPPTAAAGSTQPPAAAAPAAAQQAAPAAAPPAAEPAAAPAAAPAPVPAIGEDPRYARFFKMLKMGVPLPAAKMKASAEGLNPDYLDLDPSSPAPVGAGGAAAAPAATSATAPTPAPAPVAAPLMPQTPPAPVAAAPAAAALPAPPQPQPAEAAAPPPQPPAAAGGLTLGEDPRYARYFKMLKMGLPLGAVKHKASLEGGVDPELLELGPGAPAPP
jgi:WASH complex subunit CCDC53